MCSGSGHAGVVHIGHVHTQSFCMQGGQVLFIIMGGHGRSMVMFFSMYIIFRSVGGIRRLPSESMNPPSLVSLAVSRSINISQFP